MFIMEAISKVLFPFSNNVRTCISRRVRVLQLLLAEDAVTAWLLLWPSVSFWAWQMCSSNSLPSSSTIAKQLIENCFRPADAVLKDAWKPFIDSC